MSLTFFYILLNRLNSEFFIDRITVNSVSARYVSKFCYHQQFFANYTEP